MYYVCVYKIKISVEMYASYFYFYAINHEHVAMKNKTHIILYGFKGLCGIPSQSQLVSP